MSYTTLQEACIYKIMEGIEIAEKTFKTNFPMPTILFTKRGKVAGTASLYDNKINLNNGLLEQEGDDFINRTPLHELAHLIALKVYDDRGHGRGWKMVMRTLGQTPERCHNFDVSKVTVRKTKEFVWICNDCGKPMILKTTRHKRMMQNNMMYHLKGCRTHNGYTFTGDNQIQPVAADNPKSK